MGLRQDSILLRPSSRPKVLESYVSKYNNLYFKYFYFYSKNSIICIINIIIFIIMKIANIIIDKFEKNIINIEKQPWI